MLTACRCAFGLEAVTRLPNGPAVRPSTPSSSTRPRILAERYHEENPGTEIVYEEGPGGEDYFAWLTAGATAGTAPNMVRSTHNFAVQNGWAVAIDDYLAQPNRYAPDYDTWNDIFYPTFMNSLIQPDGKIYCAPIDNIWPNIEVGLAYNTGDVRQHGAGTAIDVERTDGGVQGAEGGRRRTGALAG